MATMRRTQSLFLVTVFFSALFVGCLDTFSQNQEPEIKAIAVTPSSNIKAGDAVTFSANAEDPDGDSLTYTWDFDESDGNSEMQASGESVEWVFGKDGTYVVTLRVEDGQYSVTETKSVLVLDAEAIQPSADAGSLQPSEDCDGEDASSGTHYLVYICDMDLEEGGNNNDINPKTSVTLDGSESTHPASADGHYITSWEWDLNIYVDSDEDGTPDNDMDAEGETFEWTERSPGKWKVQLTVTDDQGMIDTEQVWVYINYVGVWKDFSIDANNSPDQSDNPEIDFTYPSTFDAPGRNKPSRIEFYLVYEQIDSEGWAPLVPDDQKRNRLDLWIYNSTDDEVSNTSDRIDDTRTGGDCKEDYCLLVQLGSYQIDPRQNAITEIWKVKVKNEKEHESSIKEFRIELTFKI